MASKLERKKSTGELDSASLAALIGDPELVARRGTLKIGGTAFIAAGAMFFLIVAGLLLAGSGPSAIGSELSYIASRRAYYELAYCAEFTTGLLLFPSIFAIFLVLRKWNRTAATVSFGTMLVGIPGLLIAASEGLSSVSIANSFALDPNQSVVLQGAGLATLATLGSLTAATNLIFAIGSLINGALFLKSRYFGLLLGVLVVAGAALTFPGVVYSPFLVISVVLFACAFLVAGSKLYSIGVKMDRTSVPL